MFIPAFAKSVVLHECALRCVWHMKQNGPKRIVVFFQIFLNMTKSLQPSYEQHEPRC